MEERFNIQGEEKLDISRWPKNFSIAFTSSKTKTFNFVSTFFPYAATGGAL